MSTPGWRLLLGLADDSGIVVSPPLPEPAPADPVTVEDVLLFTTGVGQRADGFYIDVLDAAGTIIGQVHVDADRPPTIENNVNRVIKRDMRGLSIAPDEYDEINPFSDLLRPVMVLNGETYNLGVFLFADDTKRRRSYGTRSENILTDRMALLHDPTDRSIAYGPNTLIRDALAEQFELAGIPDFTVDDHPARFGTPFARPAGSSRADAMNEMCKLIGAHQVFFDRDGIGRVRIAHDIDTGAETLDYRDGADGHGAIYDNSVVESDGLLAAPNRWLIIDTSATDDVIIGRYDLPATAPNSIQARDGRTITRVVQMSGLEDEDAAQAAARAAAVQDRHAYSWVQFAGPIDPRHDTYDVVLFRGLRYREVRWVFTLVAPGAPMQHDLRRMYSDTEVPA